MLDNNILIQIDGGNVTGTLLNSISRVILTVLDLGRAIGSAINMAVTGRRC